MTDTKLTIIVGGYLGLIHAGGAVWDYIQYPLGLHLMGHDVYYIEDTKMFPVYSSEWNNSAPTVKRLRDIMKAFGLEDKWMYRDEVTQNVYGKSTKAYQEICKRADILINVSCANVIREEYAQIPVRILLDSDPMFTQIQINSGQSFTNEKSTLADLARWHTHHFTFGENLHREDCKIPETPFSWKTTRQPICIDYWKCPDLPGNEVAFTTLMNWKAGEDLIYNGQSWGQKDVNFPLILNLPGKVTGEHFKVAMNETGGKPSQNVKKDLIEANWQVISSDEASGDHNLYQSFIYGSKAELSVAKETYVKAKTGWFSGRSACYLANGRPVIAQDTGWSLNYPTGKGLFAFTNEGEAKDAVNIIASNWKEHSISARQIAEDYFDHRKVLNELLRSI